MVILARGNVRVVAEGLDRPESVTTGPDGTLYSGDCSGDIYRIHPDAGTKELIAHVDGIVLGLCCDDESNLYACNVIARNVVRVTQDGVVSVWSESAAGVGYTVPNYCAFDRDGNLWLSDSGAEDPDNPTGRLVRIPPHGGDGEVMDVGRPLNFPNGLCLDAEGGVLLLESFGFGISRYSGGKLEDLVHLGSVTPDGIAADASGGMLVACYYPHQLLYVAPGSTDAELYLDDPVGITLKSPANVSYFGTSLDRVAISALSGSQILEVAAPAPGLPLHYPRLIGSA